MRKLLTTSILLLALSGSAYAGNIPNDTPVPPPAPAISSEVEATSNEAQDNQTAIDVITEAALSMLQNLLNAF